jgi:cell division protein FtsB
MLPADKVFLHLIFANCLFLIMFVVMPSFGYRENSDPSAFLKRLQHKKLYILLGGALVVVILVVFSDKGILSRVKLQHQLATRGERIEQLRGEIRELKRRRYMLQRDYSTIEHVAREMHGMIRKGEIVYRVVPGSPPQNKQ